VGVSVRIGATMFKPIYINKNGYTVVATPHFMEMCYEREDIKPTDIANYFDVMYANAPKNIRCGSYFKSGCYVYYRKIYNSMRRRMEMEMISMTPADHFHTRNHDFAKEIDVYNPPQ
jgi:hypothetical protein